MGDLQPAQHVVWFLLFCITASGAGSLAAAQHTHTPVLDHYISTNLLDHEEGCIQSAAIKIYHPRGTVNEESSMTNVGTWVAKWRAGKKWKSTWSPSSQLISFPPLSLHKKDWIPLLCPPIYWRAISPCFTQRYPLVLCFFLSTSASLPLSFTNTKTHIHAHTSRSLHAQPSRSACISGSGDGSSAGTHDLFSHVASILHCHHFCFTSLCCIHRQQGRREEAAQRHVHTDHVFGEPARICTLPPLPPHHTE